MWSIFTKKSKITIVELLEVDMHSHLIPGVDDGVPDIETSIKIISDLIKLGYKKIIITPHIYHEIYPNEKNNLIKSFNYLQEKVKENDLPISLQLGAEYYVDAHLEKLIDNNDLLTFGENYILIETSFVGLSLNFEDILFKLISSGYCPIIAHPERYTYLLKNMRFFNKMAERGALFQINFNSLGGYYGPVANEILKYLLSERLVSFIGSDLHNQKHLDFLKKLNDNRQISKLLEQQPLINHRL